jgi:hypothetical protein
MWLSQCNDFEHVLKPDDGHIGLKHVAWKKTVNCECVKITDKNQQELPYLLGVLFKAKQERNDIQLDLNEYLFQDRIQVISVRPTQSVSSLSCNFTDSEIMYSNPLSA